MSRAGPNGLPCCPQATARRSTFPARSENSAPPAPRHDLPRQRWFRFVRGNWHEGPAKPTVLILARLWFCLAKPLQPQGLLCSKPPPGRIPLAREPSAWGTPPPHGSAARFIEHNSVLWPEGLLPVTLAACGRLPRPCAPAVHAARAPVRRHPSCQWPALRTLFSHARQGKRGAKGDPGDRG
jgi:hypothetical protein